MLRKFLALTGVLLCCAGCLPETATLPGVGIPARLPNGELRRLTEEEKIIVRRSVLVNVPNSSFAEFRWTKFANSPAPTDYYCAQVNAQTEPGRWVGFRPFVVSVDTVKGQIRGATLVDLSPDRIDVATVVATCRENGLDAFAATESDGNSVTNVNR